MICEGGVDRKISAMLGDMLLKEPLDKLGEAAAVGFSQPDACFLDRRVEGQICFFSHRFLRRVCA